jgi:hypothetical protein
MAARFRYEQAQGVVAFSAVGLIMPLGDLGRPTMQREEDFNGRKVRFLRTLRESIPGFRVEIDGPQAADLAVALITKQNESWNVIFGCIEAKPFLS